MSGGDRGATVRAFAARGLDFKAAGAIASSLDFPILFARIRDRISTLRALYGPGPLEIAFKELDRQLVNVGQASSLPSASSDVAQGASRAGGTPARDAS